MARSRRPTHRGSEGLREGLYEARCVTVDVAQRVGLVFGDRVAAERCPGRPDTGGQFALYEGTLDRSEVADVQSVGATALAADEWQLAEAASYDGTFATEPRDDTGPGDHRSAVPVAHSEDLLQFPAAVAPGEGVGTDTLQRVEADLPDTAVVERGVGFGVGQVIAQAPLTSGLGGL